MVEDAHPPAYEPVALSEEAADGSSPLTPPPDAHSTTSSLRATNRLLYSVGGWRASFRGFFCALAIGIATTFLAGVFSAIPWIGSFVGTLLAALALVQLETAWVHIAISSPSQLPFYKRLPPFKKTFEATCFPVLGLWAAQSVLQFTPVAMAVAFNLPIWKPTDDPTEVPRYDRSVAWKGPLIGLAVLVISLLLVLPARVALVRVQASLLPPEEDPIVPFDRSFDGKVEPSVVGGKGYVTVRDALATFPRSSWIRLYVLIFKTFLVTLAVWAVFMAVIIPEVVFMGQKSETKN
jgi:hypothetical protein